MRTKLLRFLGLAVIFALCLGRANAAPITIAGITVDSANFANALLGSATTGTFVTEGGPLATSVTDLTADTWAFSNATAAHLELGFANLVNRPGNDLVVWEIGTPDNFGMSLTVGGPIHTIVSAATGFTNSQGFGISVAFLDLDDLGVAPGASVASLVFNMGFPFANTSVSPTLGAAASLNGRVPPVSVSEPGSLLLLLGALSAFVFRRRV